MVDTDLSDIIEFIRHLKRGFDKDLFQSKLDELAYVSETCGIEAQDFHTLFKLWLNLSIPITKWTALGACLVPRDRVEERTVDYAFRWLSHTTCDSHTSFSRMTFVLDWLTAAMDTNSIDMAALDSGYGIIYNLLVFELLTPHVLKLVYKLTKPNDVTRVRVLELLDYAKKREGKKNMLRQIQVLLGLFKSYRPECVPEDVPAISIHTTFKKVNQTMLMRFKKSQERRNVTTTERPHLLWANKFNECTKNKKVEPLVPTIQFLDLGSRRYDTDPKRANLDFSNPVSLIQHVLQTGLCRPARLGSLLCNHVGLTLLAICSDRDQAFYLYNLHHMLTSTFLESSPHSTEEKAYFLQRIAALQRTLLQPLGVVTRFLAQYLPFWNESDYFPEILALVEWLSPESPEQLSIILQRLSRVYLRAAPLEQCEIMGALSSLYHNLVFSSTRSRRLFLASQGDGECASVLPSVAAAIADLCQKGLQAAPGNIHVLYSSLQAAESCARAEVEYGVALGAIPRILTFALPLMGYSAIAIDKVAELLMLYRKNFSQMKAANENMESYAEQREVLIKYSSDVLSCLYFEKVLQERKSGIIFENIHPQFIKELSDSVPNVDAQFSLRNSPAFAPYTITPMEAIDVSDVTNKLCFKTAISSTFPNLHQFLVKGVPDIMD